MSSKFGIDELREIEEIGDVAFVGMHYTDSQKLEKFGEGEWMNEYDEYIFKLFGLPCMIWRHMRYGNLNGYVGVLRDHPLSGVSYFDSEFPDDLNDNAHGGITYAEETTFPSSFFNREDWVHSLIFQNRGVCSVWTFGFDCNHAYDLSPIHKRENIGTCLEDIEQYRNVRYAFDSIRNLALNLRRYPND